MTSKRPIKISCAECFTHGKIAREIHSFARGYPSQYHWNIKPSQIKISLVGGVFAPTINSVESLLKIKPLDPVLNLDGIKVYKEKEDLKMATMMAQAVLKISNSDIGIGTSAGIGKGGISVCNDKIILSCTSEIHADLRNSPVNLILERQKSGIEKALFLLENLINGTIDSLYSENIIIRYK
ncbi:MAG: hypothetical protein CIT03_03995 [Methanobacterium sp.]|nr:MAG: hypothetical protein CIT03_03995 [Methanobacterium sp.]